MAAAVRMTLAQLRLVLATKFIYSVQLVVYDLKKSTFNLKVITSDAAGVSTNPVTRFLANAKGEPAVFKDIDTALKQIMSIAPANTTVKVVDLDSDDYVSATPTNPVKAAKSESKKLGTAITRATANETKASQVLLQIASFDGGTPAQQAIYDDAEAASVCISADKAAMADRKSELDTFIAANGG